MKKFFSVIALQVNNFNACHYEAIGDSRLDLGRETHFPVICAINAHTEKDEHIKIVSIIVDTESSHRNFEIFKEELEELKQEKGFSYELCSIVVPESETVETQISTFLKLTDYFEDNDELYTCLTYGTKPLSEALRMSVQYGYRITKNSRIACVVYGQVIRRPGFETSKIYDITALLQVDELVRVLAENKVKNPQSILNSLLTDSE